MYDGLSIPFRAVRAVRINSPAQPFRCKKTPSTSNLPYLSLHLRVVLMKAAASNTGPDRAAKAPIPLRICFLFVLAVPRIQSQVMHRLHALLPSIVTCVARERLHAVERTTACVDCGDGVGVR